MTVIEDMQNYRSRQVFGHDTPIAPDSELVMILGKRLMEMTRKWSELEDWVAKKHGDRHEQVPPEITQALALFHVWEANRR